MATRDVSKHTRRVETKAVKSGPLGAYHPLECDSSPNGVGKNNGSSGNMVTKRDRNVGSESFLPLAAKRALTSGSSVVGS